MYLLNIASYYMWFYAAAKTMNVLIKYTQPN
jgi:hypothetical protein